MHRIGLSAAFRSHCGLKSSISSHQARRCPFVSPFVLRNAPVSTSGGGGNEYGKVEIIDNRTAQPKSEEKQTVGGVTIDASSMSWTTLGKLFGQVWKMRIKRFLYLDDGGPRRKAQKAAIRATLVEQCRRAVPNPGLIDRVMLPLIVYVQTEKTYQVVEQAEDIENLKEDIERILHTDHGIMKVLGSASQVFMTFDNGESGEFRQFYPGEPRYPVVTVALPVEGTKARGNILVSTVQDLRTGRRIIAELTFLAENGKQVKASSVSPPRFGDIVESK